MNDLIKALQKAENLIDKAGREPLTKTQLDTICAGIEILRGLMARHSATKDTEPSTITPTWGTACPHCGLGDSILQAVKMEDGRWQVFIGESHIFEAKTEDEVVQKSKEWLEKHRAERKVIAPTKDTEPLAALAKRKGAKLIEISWDWQGFSVYVQWPLEGEGEGVICSESWTRDTYAAAEAKAREYLAQLPDREEK